MTAHFDAIVIGTGQAGPLLANRLTAAGMKVAIVERKLFGGTCVNTGCIPTKTMVASAYAARIAERAAEFGVEIAGGVSVDMRRVKARKDAVSEKSRTGRITPGITDRISGFSISSRSSNPRTPSMMLCSILSLF